MYILLATLDCEEGTAKSHEVVEKGIKNWLGGFPIKTEP